MGHSLDFAISLYAEKDELVSRLIKEGNDSGRSDDNIKIIIERQKLLGTNRTNFRFLQEKKYLKQY